MRVAYLVHDLNDPAVAKRLRMLQVGGLDTVVAGFWRGTAPASEIAGAQAIALGRTFDAQFTHRGMMTLRHVLDARGLARSIGPADVLLARNLEMLAIARALRQAGGKDLPIAYEVLDIHRLLLSPGRVGKLVRATERLFMKEAALLITSSPAFLREYFDPLQFSPRSLPTALLENKMLLLDPADEPERDPTPGPPWRIGWFGMIRCRRSLKILCALASRRPDLVRIEIRGRPAGAVFEDFAREIAGISGIKFGGPYAPEDVESIYRSVHFNWTIDYFEEGTNSEWLLPNRIYEGGSCNAVPLALQRTETGRWLSKLGVGALMSDPALELESFFDALSLDSYRQMKDAARLVPRSTFIADRQDCERLASLLTGLVGNQRNCDGDKAGKQAA